MLPRVFAYPGEIVFGRRNSRGLWHAATVPEIEYPGGLPSQTRFGRSLCGRLVWLTAQPYGELFPPDTLDSCSTCWRRFERGVA